MAEFEKKDGSASWLPKKPGFEYFKCLSSEPSKPPSLMLSMSAIGTRLLSLQLRKSHRYWPLGSSIVEGGNGSVKPFSCVTMKLRPNSLWEGRTPGAMIRLASREVGERFALLMLLVSATMPEPRLLASNILETASSVFLTVGLACCSLANTSSASCTCV